MPRCSWLTRLPASPCCWLAGGSTPAIAKQLAALGDDHIGYASKRFPQLGLTLVGARPFSKGGKQWSDVAGALPGRARRGGLDRWWGGSGQGPEAAVLGSACSAEAST